MQGYNIQVGNNFYCNFNCTILDCNKVEIRDRVLFGPNVSLYPATHLLQPEERSKSPELAFPIKDYPIFFFFKRVLDFYFIDWE